jgi:hypothetical protein
VRRQALDGVSVVAIIVALSLPANGIVIAFERWRLLALFAQRDVYVYVVASAITFLGVALLRRYRLLPQPLRRPAGVHLLTEPSIRT